MTSTFPPGIRALCEADPGRRRNRGPRTESADRAEVHDLAERISEAAAPSSLEAAAHAMLRLIGDHPGDIGRLRVARIVGGRTVPGSDEVQAARLAHYAIDAEFTL